MGADIDHRGGAEEGVDFGEHYALIAPDAAFLRELAGPAVLRLNSVPTTLHRVEESLTCS